ncbi:GPW/gp25 family protein [Phormidium sp. CLA17]|uniref:GPW/gp25 family protein n=1 Tax=Leptolyngbya sp. Cla-17 TaxID=2803751 RepID=UPI001491A1B6|nr:GPW/gp25 family protein [Leptolyngbya sp. Cla-17]MBM0744570.1 GPW/gp25 family protein [Leptolyngbya sp. Cla-17]
MASHIGSGIGFPLKTGVSGNLQLSAEGQNLEESIHVILRTSLGERVYRPDFGSRLSELVFAPLNTNTLLLLRLYVEEALDAWEPRIELDEILTDPDPMRGRVDITIRYHPRDSHDSRSLVYPFYLLPADVVQ